MDIDFSFGYMSRRVRVGETKHKWEENKKLKREGGWRGGEKGNKRGVGRQDTREREQKMGGEK